MRRRRATAFLAVALVAGSASAAEEPTASEAALVERILELKRQIDELLAQLPPELREEVSERLADPASAAPAVPAEPAPVAPPAAPPPAPEPVAEVAPPAAPPEPAPPPPRPRFRRTRPACNTLEAFDTNGDGSVNAMDRYWRHIYLWIDRNGDGTMDRRETVSPFEEKMRGIDVDLDTFSTVKSGLGEIRILERILLDLRGNGFSSERSRDDAVLLVDASALKRGDGPRLVSSEGGDIEGVQPFQRGWRLIDSEGKETRLNCP